MSATTFAADAVVYTRSGLKAQYLAPIAGQHVVRIFYGGGGIGGPDDESLGEPVVEPEVFAAPLTEVLASEVAHLERRAAELRAEISNGRAELDTRAKAAKDLLARVSRHEKLRDLEAYLDGKITHFVFFTEWHGVKVLERDVALSDRESNRWKQSQRLLSLYGDSNGDLSWRRSDYSDGSGGSHQVWPATSLEEALAKASELCEASYAKERKGSGYVHGHVIESARALGLPLPADLVERVRAQKVKALTEQAAATEAEAKKLRAELDALTGGAS